MNKKFILTLALISPLVVISSQNAQAMEPEKETLVSCMQQCNKTLETVKAGCENIRAQEGYQKCHDDAIKVQEACHSKCHEKYKNRNS